jgi:hypothetical protein
MGEESFRPSWGCPMWKCGFNAATADGLDIGELNTGGNPNDSDVRLVKFRSASNVAHGIRVDGDEILAIDSHGGVLSGADLVGFKFDVIKAGQTVTVVINGIGSEVLWTMGDDTLVTYALAYEDQNGVAYKNVCADNSDFPTMEVATVISGERYNFDNKTVLEDQSGWFSIACAGSALAKMKLMDYTPNNPESTAAQRQATIKMITADYCGTGESFTVDGTPLLWQNNGGSVEYNDALLPDGHTPMLEAIWDENGAVCLNTPRIADRDLVNESCLIPFCDGGEFSGEWTTWAAVPD